MNEGELSESTEGVVDELDLERADFGAAAQVRAICDDCRVILRGPYYSVNGRKRCEVCKGRVVAAQKGSFFKALVFGSLAGAVGSGIYMAIRSTGWDLALVTLVIGVMVGMGVRAGAGARTSLVYRLMAVVLTWIAMCMAYVPEVASALSGAGDDGGVATAEAVAGGDGGIVVTIVAVVMSLFVPYLLVWELEVLGVIIFGVGLWEAWRLSAPSPHTFQGPFHDAAMPGVELLQACVGMPLGAVWIQSEVQAGQTTDPCSVVFVELGGWLELVTDDGTTSIRSAPDLALRDHDPGGAQEQHPIQPMDRAHPAMASVGARLSGVSELVAREDQASMGLVLEFEGAPSLRLQAQPNRERMELMVGMDDLGPEVEVLPCSPMGATPALVAPAQNAPA